jgi:26S proteasome regulatory subunit N10
MARNSPIEYSVVCVDNSDFQRNEDFRPNRLAVQKKCVNILCHHILSARPENRVALLTLADHQTVQTLTNSEIDVMRKLYAIDLKDVDVSVCAAIKTALLVLKNIGVQDQRNHRKRIIVFIGSSLKEEDNEWEVLTKKVRKANVSMAVICFGPEIEPQIQTLRKFVGELGKDSHLSVVPKGVQMNLFLAESPLFSDSGNVSLVNENSDPELALAMKLSTADANHLDADLQRALQESLLTSGVKTDGKNGGNSAAKIIDHKESKISSQPKSDPNFMTEEEQLALSLQLSLLETQKTNTEHNKKENKEQKKSEENRK